MREAARELLRGEEAWVVGGAVRDELLGREVVDVDVACRAPERAARAFARSVAGAPFPLSERHGAWRVALDGDRTLDFTPLRDTIEADLATRDFTINAIAEPLGGGDAVDPFGGRGDLEAGVVRAVSPTVFRDDPLRLLRAVRLEDELGFAIEPGTERLIRESATLVARPAGERVLHELLRLSARGFARLDELGLLAPLGGSLERPYAALDDPEFRLVAVLGDAVFDLPISRWLARYARTLLRVRQPEGDDPRSIHRFRRQTEPYALEALAFVGAPELRDAVGEARSRDLPEPLLRGDELGLPPGPEIARILALVDEEVAAGTVTTREEALELVRRRAGTVREDG